MFTVVWANGLVLRWHSDTQGRGRHFWLDNIDGTGHGGSGQEWNLYIISTTWVRWVEYLIVLDRYRELVWYCSVHGACVWTEQRPRSCLDSTKTHAQPHDVIYTNKSTYMCFEGTLLKRCQKGLVFSFHVCLFFCTHHTEFGRKTAQSFVIAVEAVWIARSTTCHWKKCMRDVISASNKTLP